MRVELRLLNPAAIALACCLAVPWQDRLRRVRVNWPRREARSPVSAYGFADLTNPGNERAPTGPPAGLRVGDTLYPLLQRMWRRSPTFRRQCAQLDEAGITMSVHLGLPRGTGINALTRIEVQAGVVRHATVYLEPTLWRAYEFLAHEIEHVLEQIDGVNLRVLAQQFPRENIRLWAIRGVSGPGIQSVVQPRLPGRGERSEPPPRYLPL
jgi:hypothetical protein